MNIDIAGRHFDLTEGLREHVFHKMGKIEKYALRIVSARVICEVQKIHHICEITIQGSHFKMAAKEKTGDMYLSFDKALERIGHQLAKLHEKNAEHRASDPESV